MIYILVGSLLLIVILFGFSASLNSYVSVKQADAVIEVAKVAQVNAWGNLAVIGLGVLIVLLIVVGIVALVLFMTLRRQQFAGAAGYGLAKTGRTGGAPDINMLVQMEMLRTLRSLNAPQQELDRAEVIDFPQWLLK